MILRGKFVAGLGKFVAGCGGVTVWLGEHASWLGGVAAERGDDRDVETLCGVAASLPQS